MDRKGQAGISYLAVNCSRMVKCDKDSSIDDRLWELGEKY